MAVYGTTYIVYTVTHALFIPEASVEESHLALLLFALLLCYFLVSPDLASWMTVMCALN